MLTARRHEPTYLNLHTAQRAAELAERLIDLDGHGRASVRGGGHRRSNDRRAFALEGVRAPDDISRQTETAGHCSTR